MDSVDKDFDKTTLPDAKAAARHVFRNGSWEVQLLFEQTDKGWLIRPDSSIKNIDAARKPLDVVSTDFPDGVVFRASQGGASRNSDNDALIAFEGAPLPPDQTRTLAQGKYKDGFPWKGGDPKQAVQMQQVLVRPWVGQWGMYTWPTTKPNEPGKQHPLNTRLAYPSNTFAVDDLDWYKGNKESSPYKKQFDDLKHLLVEPAVRPKRDANDHTPVAPIDLPLAPVVFQGGYDAIMTPADVAAVKGLEPEECWLLQEDFWVKRELLNVLCDAMSLAEHMDLVDGEFDKVPLPDPKPLAHHVFRNDSWEVTLYFDRNEDGKWRIRSDSTIKNVHASHRDQPLDSSPDGTWFRLAQGGAVTIFAFEGDRVPWGGQRTLAQWKEDGKKQDWLLKAGDPTQAIQLDQLFDSGNTPITRIDEIELSKLSHRESNRPLVAAKPERFGLKPAEPVKTDATAGANSPAAPPGPGGSNGMAPPGNTSGPNGIGQASGNGQPTDDLTANKELHIHKNRYLYVTDQSRHLPLAITLTVDQAHLHEVLAAFANSRLRFQTTQVEFRRIPTEAPSSTAAPGGFGESAPPAGGTSGGLNRLRPSTGAGGTTAPPSGNTSRPGPGGTGGFPGNPNGGTSNTEVPNGAGTTNGAPAEQDNPNLIEVTIYGVASLYERPPAAGK